MEAAIITFRPVTPENWDDFETLFGPRGACAGCWCMYWRTPRKEFSKNQGEPFRLAMKNLVDGGTVPGLLAYAGEKPIGWIAIAPREEFILLETSKVLAPVDDQAVWSIVCFFIARRHRHQRLSMWLAQAAVDYARASGAAIVEAYPIDTCSPAYPDAYAYTGLLSTFTRIGFSEVGRRSPSRPIVRYRIQPRAGEKGAKHG